MIGTALPCSLLWGWFMHTCDNGVGSIVLPMQGEGSVLACVLAGGDEGQLSHSYNHRANSPIYSRCYLYPSTYQHPVIPGQFVDDAFFPSLYNFGFFIKN